jgi:acetyltransferase
MDFARSSDLPATFELSNGQTVTVRMIQPGDAPLLVEMFQHLSERTRRLRYHAYTADLPLEKAVMLSDLDPSLQAALVAVVDGDAGEHIVGVTRLARASAGAVDAETAVVVRDDFQGLGLGTHLLTLLLSIARSMGIGRLFGWVMSENRYMLQLFKRVNLPIQLEYHSGDVLVVLSLTTPPDLAIQAERAEQ